MSQRYGMFLAIAEAHIVQHKGAFRESSPPQADFNFISKVECFCDPVEMGCVRPTRYLPQNSLRIAAASCADRYSSAKKTLISPINTVYKSSECLAGIPYMGKRNAQNENDLRILTANCADAAAFVAAAQERIERGRNKDGLSPSNFPQYLFTDQ